MRTTWNGSLSFGLVSIPVGLAPATKPAARQSDVSFRLLHRECATPIKQKRWCPTHDREVAQDELVGLLGKKPPSELRPLVVLALARVGDERVSGELASLLSQDSYRLRAVAAVGSLGQKAQSLTEPLLPLLSSSDPVLQKTAAASLLALAEKESHVRGD